MKKIAIYSFFNSHNIGDILIADQIKKLFSNRIDCVFFDIGDGSNAALCSLKKFSHKENRNTIKAKLLKTPFLGDLIRSILYFSSKKYHNILQSAENSDIVIFAGGNQLMELYSFPTDIITYYKVVKKLKKQNKIVCFCFCGTGPFKSKLSEKIAAKILKLADFISVRDEYSLALTKKYLPNKNIDIWCDPVLLMKNNTTNNNFAKAIGINVYFGHDSKFKKMMYNSYVSVIKLLRENFPEIKLYLFSSELTDINDIISIKDFFADDDMIIIEEILSAEDLFAFYNNVDIVLAARMHTAITATISNLPVVTIAWQKKVSAFTSLMKNQEFNFDLETFFHKPNLVYEIIKYLIENRNDIINKNLTTLSDLRNETTKKFNRFIKLLEEENEL